MREENDEVIDEFLAQHDDYTLAPPSELPASLAKVLDKRGMLRCYPDLHDTDGFFAARLVRRS
jgi:16S rRNA (cytosine967-C5)-methyltransferase